MKSKWEYIPFCDAVEIWDTLRKPINSKERSARIEGKAESELYPYYGATGQVGLIDDYITDGEYVLLGEDGAPFLNSFAQKAYLINGKTWVNNHAHVLRSKTNNRFLCYYLNYFNYKGYVSGTTRLKLTQAQMKTIPIPNPDADEQKRIVDKIEELFSQIDDGVETLNKTKEQLKVYRQAVLCNAFKTLNNTIDMEKIATMLDPHPSHRTPPEVDGGTPYIGIGDIDYDAQVINFDNARKVSMDVAKEHLERYTLQEGDFVMGKIGTIGKPFKLPLPQNYTLSANVILIQPNLEFVMPEFLFWQFASPYITQQLMQGATATSQPAFGIKKARKLQIKICNKKTQCEILNDIQAKMSICDNIEGTVNKAIIQVDALRQSILKKAFEGEM